MACASSMPFSPFIYICLIYPWKQTLKPNEHVIWQPQWPHVQKVKWSFFPCLNCIWAKIKLTFTRGILWLGVPCYCTVLPTPWFCIFLAILVLYKQKWFYRMPSSSTSGLETDSFLFKTGPMTGSDFWASLNCFLYIEVINARACSFAIVTSMEVVLGYNSSLQSLISYLTTQQSW